MSLAFAAMMVGLFQERTPEHGSLLHGHDLTLSRLCLCSCLQRVQKVLEDLKQLAESNDYVPLVLNSHCEICEFEKFCRTKAMEEDNLSLLSGMRESQIKRYNQKGFFTVNQLSHTFRYRKPRKRAKNPSKPHYFALQALSLRTDTIHIHGNPSLPMAQTHVYFDIEALPDRDFLYLIGALRIQGSEVMRRQFWADEEEEQNNIIEQFLDFVVQARDYHLFHFGSYDVDLLRKARPCLSSVYQGLLNKVADRSTNLLSVVHHHIYFPTYSNGLKEIGRYLGATWSIAEASGRYSVLWRELWEQRRQTVFKSRLLQYNHEDCLALKLLHDFIADVIERTPGNASEQHVIHTDELPKSPTKWSTYGRPAFHLREFERINECAYFDYQREHVFVRTNRRFRGINRRANRKLSVPKVNRTMDLNCSKCLNCGSRCRKAGRKKTRTLIDLRFSRAGVKRRITQYVSWPYRCQKCGKIFLPEGWPTSRHKYGRNLVSWCVYLNLVCKQKRYQTRDTLRDLFELDVSQRSMYQFKTRIAREYSDLCSEIKERILNGPIIHIDETPVKLNKGKGYVWVVANMDSVFYFYRETRKGDFLKDMLSDFSGVLISDFFTAYDSPECAQQKCLLHLIRDFNEDLQRNPYDDEFKEIAHHFAVLLCAIVETVDRFGLKRRHLHKHRKAAIRFMDNVGSGCYSSEIAQKYQKRIRKYGERLFTFLNHDNVPWNNNNAEHALKKFRKFIKLSDGLFTDRTFSEACVLLTVLETCDFNNINKLDFLLSGQHGIGAIIK
jgi:predicted RecB family nuclease